MSIVTKTGDKGTTALMYNRRVPKNHPRMEAVGAIDELNSALGVARAGAEHGFVSGTILPIQKELITLMGEIAVAKEDLGRYEKDGFELVKPEMTARLEALVREIEGQKVSLKGWATPGGTANAAALDLARSVCRRAERAVYALVGSGEITNPEILIYLNRLADLLWLMARWVETQKA